MNQAFDRHPLHSSRAARCLGSLLAALASAGAGCNWTEFDDLEKNAPIRVHDAPQNYRKTGFGGVLTAFTTDYTGTQRSIVVASAGRDAPVVFERLWNGARLIEDSFIRCKSEDECKEGVGVGSALIAFPHWALDTAQQEDGCVFSPGYGKGYVFCDSNTSANASFDLELEQVVMPGNSAGFSGAGLPAAHPLGVFLLGAYQISARTEALSRGRLFYQPDFQPEGAPDDSDRVPPLEELPLLDPLTGALFADDPMAGDLGFALAAAPRDDDTLVIAVAQPARGRVIVALYDDAIPGDLDNKLATVACVDAPAGAGGFGERLAMADIDGDGLPEIAVGSDPVDSSERVLVYPGRGLPLAASPTDCPGWAVEPIEVTCREGVHDVRCADSGFGGALAFGDVNGDGAKELLVGAPNADVAGRQEAGAVWIFAGTDNPRAPLDLDAATNLHAGNGARAHLGASLAALHTAERDEPVAGAPGEARLFTFMCSELEDDVNGNPLCLPR